MLCSHEWYNGEWVTIEHTDNINQAKSVGYDGEIVYWSNTGPGGCLYGVSNFGRLFMMVREGDPPQLTEPGAYSS